MNADGGVAASSGPRPLRSLEYGFILAMASLVALAVAALLYRWRLAGLSGLLLIPVALVFALVAVMLSVVGFVAGRRRQTPRGMGKGIAGLVVALAVLMFPVVVAVNARGTAPIHDVTTDTMDPPGFIEVLPIRAQTGALNPVEYGGARAGAPPPRSLPDITPLRPDRAPPAGLAPAAGPGRATNRGRRPAGPPCRPHAPPP